jgi:hypothetical protein
MPLFGLNPFHPSASRYRRNPKGGIPGTNDGFVCSKTFFRTILGSSVGQRKPRLEGTPGYYRERAAEMLKKAQEADTDNARNSYLLLAQGWDNLAQNLERPIW